jgi:ABC-2 type transport system ATP-binding protein
MNGESAIASVRNLIYEYPGIRALNDVSFDLTRGSVTALVGPNGAGKTTLLRCIAALDQPLQGEIRIDGIDVLEQPRESHRRIGYLSDFFGLYDALTVRQSLTYAALSQGMADEAAAKAADTTAQRLQIDSKLSTRCSELSRGQRQRVAIGQALIHSPALLILDEPASGLDPEARHELAQVFRTLQADGTSLIVSSHILAELDEYSTHMLVIRDGSIREHRALHEGVESDQHVRVVVEFSDDNTDRSQAIAAALTPMDAVQLLHSQGNEAAFSVPLAANHRTLLLRALLAANLPVIGMREEREDLQQSYLRSLKETGGAT